MAAEPDPYAPLTAPAGSFEALLHGAVMGEPGADAALQRWLSEHPEASAQTRERGYHRLCGDYAVLTWHRVRREVCAAETRAAKPAATGDDSRGMAEVLADTPPIRAVGAARIRLSWNAFGSQSVDVAVKGVTSPWFFDTGAEISVVPASLADRIGVRYVGERVRVGTSTADVFGRVGVIDVMTIGAASVENVPVLVLPDSQLTIGGTRMIPGILGLQVMVAFGRVAWVARGEVIALGEAAPHAGPTAPRLYWHEEGLGVPVETSLGVRGAVLDTGANTTDWRHDGLDLLTPAVLASARERTSRVGGAGGVVEIKQRSLAALSLRFAGAPVALSNIAIVAEPQVSAARVGMDAVSQLDSLVLDFEAMRIEAHAKPPGRRSRSARHVLTQDELAPGAQEKPSGPAEPSG